MRLELDFGRWPFVSLGKDRGNPPLESVRRKINRDVDQARETFRGEFEHIEDKEILEGILEPIKVKVVSHDDFSKILVGATSQGRLLMDADALFSEDHAFEVSYRYFLAKLLAFNNMAFFQYSPNFARGTIEYLVRQATIREKGLYRPGTYEPQIDVVVRLIKGGVSEDLWKKSLHNERALGELEGRINEVMGNEKGFEELEKVMNGPDRRRLDRMLPPPV